MRVGFEETALKADFVPLYSYDYTFPDMTEVNRNPDLMTNTILLTIALC